MSDLVIRFSRPDYHGKMTFIPDERTMQPECGRVPIPGSGDWGASTLEFDLLKDQFVPVDIPKLRIRLKVYCDHFDVVKLPEEFWLLWR